MNLQRLSLLPSSIDLIQIQDHLPPARLRRSIPSTGQRTRLSFVSAQSRNAAKIAATVASGEGFDKSESLPMITGIRTLRRLTLTNCRALTDADLKQLAAMKQLESLELGSLLLGDERLPLLQAFSHLKELRLIDRKVGYPAETQAKIKALLPKVAVVF